MPSYEASVIACDQCSRELRWNKSFGFLGLPPHITFGVIKVWRFFGIHIRRGMVPQPGEKADCTFCSLDCLIIYATAKRDAEIEASLDGLEQ